MKRHQIPTAEYECFTSYGKACQYLDSVQHDVVIKASGLAGGKGVLMPQTKLEAHKALKEVMLDREFGDAGDEVVIEEYLEGDELSVLTFSDGYTIRSLPPAQDHKRVFDGDQGPNTGGMGCYAPTPIATKEVIENVDKNIIQPSIDGMRREGQSNTRIYQPRRQKLILYRIPLRWYPLHWSHDDQEWTQSPRI